jgi:hypothetical protein
MKFAFDLWAYDDVTAHADAILERLRNGSMPCDGAWPNDRVEIFQQWVDTGNAPWGRHAMLRLELLKSLSSIHPPRRPWHVATNATRSPDRSSLFFMFNNHAIVQGVDQIVPVDVAAAEA